MSKTSREVSKACCQSTGKKEDDERGGQSQTLGLGEGSLG